MTANDIDDRIVIITFWRGAIVYRHSFVVRVNLKPNEKKYGHFSLNLSTNISFVLETLFLDG